MKKYVLLTALAIVIAAPAYAQTVNETNVKRTPTAVEKAAIEQGFSPANPGADGAGSAPAPDMSDMGADAPAGEAAAAPGPMLSSDAPASAVAAANGRTVASGPAVIHTQENGLPKGLVMNGPGTDAYKQKHHVRKKKKKAAVEQAAPAAEEPMGNAAPVLPDANAMAPAPAEPVVTAPEPAPLAAPTPSPAPSPTPVPSPEAMPAPSPDPLAPNAPAADPFAPQQ